METGRVFFSKAAIAAVIIVCDYLARYHAQSSDLSIPKYASGLSLTKYASDLAALQKLTTTSASMQAGSSIDVTAATSRCARESEQAQTYSSYAQRRDRSKKELASSDYVVIKWYFDFVRPDQYHVVQAVSSPDFLDEWITTGTGQFDSLGFDWFKEGPEQKGIGRPELNRKLGMQKYVDVLKKLAPLRSTSYLYGNQQYLRLEYLLSIPGDFGSFLEGTHKPVQLVFWVTPDSGRLVKVHAIPAAETHSETPSQEFEQEFVGYGADVRIDRPRHLMPIAGSTPDLNTRDDISQFMEEYYLQPRPDLIADLIDALQPTGFVQKTTVPVVMGFFSEVFAANPDRIPNWQVLIAKQDEQTKTALNRALAVSKGPGVIHSVEHSAEGNDLFWGAFFASGNPKFIKKLVDQLKYFDERDDFTLFAAGGTAMWSLASNAQSRPRVREAIEKAKPTADKRSQELITELLAEDPERIKQEMGEIINNQRQAGKWK